MTFGATHMVARRERQEERRRRRHAGAEDHRSRRPLQRRDQRLGLAHRFVVGPAVDVAAPVLVVGVADEGGREMDRRHHGAASPRRSGRAPARQACAAVQFRLFRSSSGGGVGTLCSRFRTNRLDHLYEIARVADRRTCHERTCGTNGATRRARHHRRARAEMPAAGAEERAPDARLSRPARASSCWPPIRWRRSTCRISAARTATACWRRAATARPSASRSRRARPRPAAIGYCGTASSGLGFPPLRRSPRPGAMPRPPSSGAKAFRTAPCRRVRIGPRLRQARDEAGLAVIRRHQRRHHDRRAEIDRQHRQVRLLWRSRRASRAVLVRLRGDGGRRGPQT